MSWDVLKRRGIRELGGEGLQLGCARGRVKRQATSWPCKRLLRLCYVREENGKFGPAVRRACMALRWAPALAGFGRPSSGQEENKRACKNESKTSLPIGLCGP